MESIYSICICHGLMGRSVISRSVMRSIVSKSVMGTMGRSVVSICYGQECICMCYYGRECNLNVLWELMCSI